MRPIVHRTFINSAIFAAFPVFCLTPLKKGFTSFTGVEQRDLNATTGAVAPTKSPWHLLREINACLQLS